MVLDLRLTRFGPGRQKPFRNARGFNRRWWCGAVPDPRVWCSFEDPGHGEVARAELRLNSDVGVAYPTYTVPYGGATEILLLEVREDRRGSDLHVGAASVARIRETMPGPFVALSGGPDTDGFWRRQIRWLEHDHADRPSQLEHDAMLPMQLFAAE